MNFALVAENDTAPPPNNGDESASAPVKALEDTQSSRPQPSSSNSIQSRSSPSSISQPPPASDPANDVNPAAFVDRILMAPLVNTILRAYEQIKTSSEVVKYGAEMMESSTGTILRLVIILLPVAQLDEFACRQLDRFYGRGGNTSRASIPEEREEKTVPSTPEVEHGPQTAPPKSTPPDPMDPASGVLYNPFPPGGFIPPWYRSQSNEPGRPRLRSEIVGGLVIPLAEGVAWIKRITGMDLNPDHSEDLTVRMYLAEAIRNGDHPYDAELAQRRDVPWYDFLLVTQWTSGRFVNIGPDGVEEVLQDDLKNVLKSGELEDMARKVAFRDFGINTAEFKLFFAY